MKSNPASLRVALSLFLIASLVAPAPSRHGGAATMLAPPSLPQTSRKLPSRPADIFVAPIHPGPIPNDAFSQMPSRLKLKSPMGLNQGEEITRELIKLALQAKANKPQSPENDLTLFYLDLNNLKLRNWIYTDDIVDVLIRDVDDEIVRIVEKVSATIAGKSRAGTVYAKGADERVIVLPTADPAAVNQVIWQIKTYMRRQLAGKYKVAVLQLDDDSRILTEGKEHPKNDAQRKLIFEGVRDSDGHVLPEGEGVVELLENAPSVLKVLRHAEQYYLVYEDPEKLEVDFLKIQERFP